MECLPLVSLFLDLPQSLQGMDHNSLACASSFRTEVVLVNEWFIQLNLVLPVENEAMGSPIPMTISNPHQSDVRQESWKVNRGMNKSESILTQLIIDLLGIGCCLKGLHQSFPLALLSDCIALSKTAYIYFCLALNRSCSPVGTLNDRLSTSEISCACASAMMEKCHKSHCLGPFSTLNRGDFLFCLIPSWSQKIFHF